MYTKMPKKQYDSREITLIGRTENSPDGDKACEVCTEADQYLNTVTKHDNRTTYKKIEVDSDEGQEIAEKEEIDNIPYIKDCKTYKEGDTGKERTRCRTIEGFDEDDWSDLNKLVPKAEKKEVKEEEPKVDKETGIKEPVEPIEPEID